MHSSCRLRECEWSLYLQLTLTVNISGVYFRYCEISRGVIVIAIYRRPTVCLSSVVRPFSAIFLRHLVRWPSVRNMCHERWVLNFGMCDRVLDVINHAKF